MKSIVRPSALRILQVLPLALLAPLAEAYIGPGSGISVIGSLLGLLATIVIALGAIALFPFRKMMKKNAAKRKAESEESDAAARSEGAPLESAGGEGLDTR